MPRGKQVKKAFFRFDNPQYQLIRKAEMKLIGVLPLMLLCVGCSPTKEQPKLNLPQNSTVQSQQTSEASTTNINSHTKTVDATAADALNTNTQNKANAQSQPPSQANQQEDASTDIEAENLVEINTHTTGGLSYSVKHEHNDTVDLSKTAAHSGQNKPSPHAIKQVYSEDLGAVLIGEYVGNLPCKSCKFIQVLLQLDVDGTAKKTTSYIINGEPLTSTTNSVVERGYYTQKGGVINIDFLSENKQESYQIEGSNLILLQDNQSEVMDITASDYVLAKR